MEDKTIFIKRLNEEKMKKLIYYGLLVCDNEENTNFLTNKSFKDVTITYKNYDNNYIYLTSLSYNSKDFNKYQYNNLIYNANFKMNDFEMIIFDGKWYKDLNNVLYMYLSETFLNEYPDYLYNKRVEDALDERRFILDNSLEYLSNLEKNIKKVRKK